MLKVVVIVTAIIVTIAILMVIYMGLFESKKDIKVPHGHIIFTHDPADGEGTWWGDFGGSVNYKDIKITLYDVSLDKTAIMDKPRHEDKVEIPNGCNMTYYNWNKNDKLDGGDSFIVQGVESGDWIIITYKPTDEIICQWMFD